MSITDELRAEVHRMKGWCCITDTYFDKLCDRIDAEHKKACDDAWDNGYEADYLGIEKWLTEHPQVMEHHGWIRLPKDADGEPIRIGDVMEWMYYDETNQLVIRTVSGVGADVFFAWSGANCQYGQYDAQAFRHYKQPTVEDVLTEFGIDWEHEDNCEDRAALLAEYAKRLKLAGEAE